MASGPKTLTPGTKNHAIKRTPVHDGIFSIRVAQAFPRVRGCLVLGGGSVPRHPLQSPPGERATASALRNVAKSRATLVLSRVGGIDSEAKGNIETARPPHGILARL